TAVPDPAPDVWRENAPLVARYFEHAGNVVAAVLRSLGLIENGDSAVAVPYRRSGERLHWIVVLDRHAILGFDPCRRPVKGCRWFAASNGVRRIPLRNLPPRAAGGEVRGNFALLLFGARQRNVKAA